MKMVASQAQKTTERMKEIEAIEKRAEFFFESIRNDVLENTRSFYLEHTKIRRTRVLS